MTAKTLKVEILSKDSTKQLVVLRVYFWNKVLTNNQPQWKFAWNNGTEITVTSRAIKNWSRTYEDIQINIDNDPKEEARLIQIALQRPDGDIGQVSVSSDDSDSGSNIYIRYLAYYNGFAWL